MSVALSWRSAVGLGRGLAATGGAGARRIELRLDLCQSAVSFCTCTSCVQREPHAPVHLRTARRPPSLAGCEGWKNSGVLALSGCSPGQGLSSGLSSSCPLGTQLGGSAGGDRVEYIRMIACASEHRTIFEQSSNEQTERMSIALGFITYGPGAGCQALRRTICPRADGWRVVGPTILRAWVPRACAGSRGPPPPRSRRAG